MCIEKCFLFLKTFLWGKLGYWQTTLFKQFCIFIFHAFLLWTSHNHYCVTLFHTVLLLQVPTFHTGRLAYSLYLELATLVKYCRILPMYIKCYRYFQLSDRGLYYLLMIIELNPLSRVHYFLRCLRKLHLFTLYFFKFKM